MTTDEIIKLGTNLGLNFNRDSCFRDHLENSIVVFDGINGQRFLIDGNTSDEEILKKMGESLVLMGRRQLKLDLGYLLCTTGDN